MAENSKKWCFQGNHILKTASGITIRQVLNTLRDNINKDDPRPAVPLGLGDPSPFPTFRVTPVAEDAVVDAIKSGNFNHYSPGFGLLPARRAIAENISIDLPYTLSSDDVYLTVGAKHAMEVMISVLARRPGANILLPRPGFPTYHSIASFRKVEVRHYDLAPEKGWEVDLESVEALADENSVAIVIISPGNPCGNVFANHHLKKIAETARKLGIFVIADEVYAHLTFGSNQYVRMGEFGSIVPVISLGSLSKRWVVPGWRLGWIAVCDPDGIFKELGIVQSIKSYLIVSNDPATFIQAAVPEIFQKTEGDFFSKIVNLLKQDADLIIEHIKEIPCLTCPHKPEGSMFVMVKLDPTFLEDVIDDLDFCLKLAREESVIVLPGVPVGLKNWLRITFAVEPDILEDGLRRIKSFCQKHAKKR